MNGTSAAAQVIISLIPIVGIFMGSIVIFFYLLWNFRRRTLLIKAGHYSRPEFNLLTFSLLSGLLLSSVGIALTIFLSVAVEKVSYGLLGGIIPLATGAGLLIFYLIKRFEPSTSPDSLNKRSDEGSQTGPLNV